MLHNAAPLQDDEILAKEGHEPDVVRDQNQRGLFR